MPMIWSRASTGTGRESRGFGSATSAPLRWSSLSLGTSTAERELSVMTASRSTQVPGANYSGVGRRNTDFNDHAPRGDLACCGGTIDWLARDSNCHNQLRPTADEEWVLSDMAV